MEAYLDLKIYYNSLTKQWNVDYKSEKSQYNTIMELLTFIGKKCLVLQNNIEFQYKALTKELEQLFS